MKRLLKSISSSRTISVNTMSGSYYVGLDYVDTITESI